MLFELPSIAMEQLSPVTCHEVILNITHRETAGRNQIPFHHDALGGPAMCARAALRLNKERISLKEITIPIVTKKAKTSILVWSNMSDGRLGIR